MPCAAKIRVHFYREICCVEAPWRKFKVLIMEKREKLSTWQDSNPWLLDYCSCLRLHQLKYINWRLRWLEKRKCANKVVYLSTISWIMSCICTDNPFERSDVKTTQQENRIREESDIWQKHCSVGLASTEMERWRVVLL